MKFLRAPFIASSLGLLLISSVATGCAAAQRSSGSRAPAEEAPLSWLTGCWQTADGNTEEFWRRSIQGSQLFGYSVTRNAGKRTFFEQLRIDAAERTLWLHAYPAGVGPTSFSGTLVSPGEVVFHNKDNDYPQQISYTLVDNSLHASIALADGTQQRNWRYKPCP